MGVSQRFAEDKQMEKQQFMPPQSLRNEGNKWDCDPIFPALTRALRNKASER
jgi:hypothetical protein